MVSHGEAVGDDDGGEAEGQRSGSVPQFVSARLLKPPQHCRPSIK